MCSTAPNQNPHSVLLFANYIVVFYREGTTGVVECKEDVRRVRKMTFKKDDRTILSLYLQDPSGDVRIFRVKLDEAEDFCQDIQIMIEDSVEE